MKGSLLHALLKNKDYKTYLRFIQLVSGEFNRVSLFYLFFLFSVLMF